jgi:transposase
MKEPDLQTTVLTLYQTGQSRKTIARSLRIDIKTVRSIIKHGSIRSTKARHDRTRVEPDLLEKLFADCQGYRERMHEKLTEEHGIKVGYSTLTRLVRMQGLGKPKKRSDQVPDTPGDEMQLDTTIYSLMIGPTKRKVICCGIYLRYSKMRYIRFYYRFNRFVMKCFLHEALLHWGYSAQRCIIDNTNLAIHYGSGQRAVFNPEMVHFAKSYGFTWFAHEIRHSNRKAGTERNFYTVETNFLPGRTFTTIEDLNSQAVSWATERYARRPLSRTKLIPAELFEYEKPFLTVLNGFISAPYLELHRTIDQYGYVAIEANYYWVPEKIHSPTVKVLRYADHVCIFQDSTQLVRYTLARSDIRNQRFVPEDIAQKPRGVPKNRKLGCEQEEKHLRELGNTVAAYLDFIQSPQTAIAKKAAFIRSLYALSRQVGKALFLQTIERVTAYKITDIAIVQRTVQHFLKSALAEALEQPGEEMSDYKMRQAYLDGKFTEENDASTPIV